MNSHGSQTPQPGVLDVALNVSPISRSVQQAILQELWMASDHQDSMRVYFEFYSKRIHRFRVELHSDFYAQSHSDIVSIAKAILSGTSRDDILATAITASDSTSAYLEDSTNAGIDMCASLVLMAETKSEREELQTGMSYVPWNQGTFQDAVASYFSPQKLLQPDRQKLDGLFTARNLNRMAGIRIKWTTNLADHLLLHDDDKAVAIFHCVSFLQFQKSASNSILPERLIQETLTTIRLLFPCSDKETARWLENFPEIDSKLKLCGSLGTRDRRLEKFTYWHDRLVMLKQAFDESNPQTVSQLWFDKRNSVRWYFFWIGILFFVVTVFFGIVMSVEGALQVWLAFKNNRSG